MNKLFSLTKKDFEIQTFSVGGPGGGGKDTSNSGVRVVHLKSGAVGEGRETRSNSQNRKAAFERLTATTKFQNWLKTEIARQTGRRELPEVDVGSGNRNEKIRTYNYVRHEVIDHRTGEHYPLQRTLDGELDPIISDLLNSPTRRNPSSPRNEKH